MNTFNYVFGFGTIIYKIYNVQKYLYFNAYTVHWTLNNNFMFKRNFRCL